MATTRTPADDLAAQLKREGYYPHWHPSPCGFQCRLINNVINGVPHAEGDTIYDALEAALRHRDAMVKEGIYAKR
jgi:hypothetical protein